ncbi:MAG: hypothetical protein CTY19_02395 [Methylomonas sp.]|nr:MAG: hypothetical protein CTY19_02395 [Methylomonas sp.]
MANENGVEARQSQFQYLRFATRIGKDLVTNNAQKLGSYQRPVYAPFFDTEGLGEILQINPPL